MNGNKKTYNLIFPMGFNFGVLATSPALRCFPIYNESLRFWLIILHSQFRQAHRALSRQIAQALDVLERGFHFPAMCQVGAIIVVSSSCDLPFGRHLKCRRSQHLTTRLLGCAWSFRWRHFSAAYRAQCNTNPRCYCQSILGWPGWRSQFHCLRQ